MNNRYKIIAAASFALLLLAACSSGGLYGTNPNNGYNNDIRGTVDYVDTSSRSIYLINAYSPNGSMLSSGTGTNSVRVYYDNNTRVMWQGQNYNPQDLEHGDQVDISVNQSGNQLYANNVTVTQNVRTSGTYPNNPSGTYNTTVHGTVRSLDTSRQTITLDPGYGSYVIVQYNSNTPVYYNGQTYMPANLEIGDQIDVQGQNLNNGTFSAQNITVTSSVSASNGTYTPSTATSLLRGTVDYLDTVNHTISLTQTNWMAGFDRGAGNGNTIVVQYDPSVQVNVNGQMYAVSGLQRGDIVDLQLQNLGGSSYLARQITLVRDVNAR